MMRGLKVSARPAFITTVLRNFPDDEGTEEPLWG